MPDLHKKVLKASFWSTLQNGVECFFKFIVTIIFIQFLSASTFGLIALIILILEGIQIFLNLGLGAAIIQCKKLTDKHLHSVFCIHLILSVLFFSLLWLFSDIISNWFQEPEMNDILKIMALSLIFKTLKLIPHSLSKKKMEFKKIALITIFSKFFSSCVALIIIYQNDSAWALVSWKLIDEIIVLILFWFFSEYQPKLRFNYSYFLELFIFSYFLIGSHFLSYLRKRSVDFIISFFLGSLALGHYSVAKNIVESLVNFIIHPFSTVNWVMLSHIQTQLKRFCHIFYKSQELLIVLISPLIFFIISFTPEIIQLMFKGSWQPSVSIIQALAFQSFIVAIIGSQLSAITAIGKSNYRFKLEVLITFLTITMLVISIPFGINIIVWVQSITLLIMLPISSTIILHILPLNRKKLIISIIKPLLVSGLATVSIYILKLTIKLDIIILIFIGLLINTIFLKMLMPHVLKQLIPIKNK